MPTEIVLLTGEAEGPALGDMLRACNPALTVHHVLTAEELADAAGRLDLAGHARLIAFCTGVVVPPAVLAAFPGPAYNFHPGPPTFPGSHAAGFAIYEGARRFGATVHVMEDRVDEGAIVGVEWFDVPDDPKLRCDELEIMAYKALVGLFQKLARHLACDDAPLPPIGETWSGRKRTKKDVESLKDLPPDVSEEEVRLRFRAFG